MTTTTSSTVRDWLKYLFPEELRQLKMLAQTLSDNPVIVNIGAGGGTSGLAFVEARADVRLYTIDITDKSSPFGCLEAERVVFEQAGFPMSTQRWTQIHGDSKTVDWDGGEVDMVFIDGDHSYMGCAGDISVWWPRLKPGGIMAIHDFDKERVFSAKSQELVAQGPHPSSWPGVNRAVREFSETASYQSRYTVDTLIVFFASQSLTNGRGFSFMYDWKKLASLPDGTPCSPGCEESVSSSCQICGRLAMTREQR